MSLTEIFENMEYGSAPESPQIVREWLEAHPNFGQFINGDWMQGKDHFPSINPATGEVLAQIAMGDADIVDAAIHSARNAQSDWEKLGGKTRARYLYAISRHIQKNARFLAVLETLDNGKPIRETRDGDIPLAARHFYHHAGWAQLENEFQAYAPMGVVGQIIPWNFPFLMLAWKIAPALAAGNTVVLKPAEQTSLTALYFAQICQEIGLPKGVVNIVTGAGETGAALVAHDGIDKLAFTGSTAVGRQIQQRLAPRGTPLSLELGGKSPIIVFEDADLDAAVEGVVNAIWYNQGEVCCAGSRLLVQESVADRLYAKLRARMDKLRIGDPLDKSIDIGALVSQSQCQQVSDLVNQGLAEGGEIYQPPGDLPKGCYYKPSLITGVHPAHRLAQEEIFGPVIVATSFRTEKEAVTLANNTRYGLAASLWSENLDQCLSVAPLVDAGVVWINSHNLFDAAAGFGGVKESGFGREGGHNGMLEYVQPAPIKAVKKQPLKLSHGSIEPAIDVTRKFFIAGKQARPDSGYSRKIQDDKGRIIDEIGIANRKDLRNAVEAAHASSWPKANAHNRAQILYYFGEKLDRRRTEFEANLALAMGKTKSRDEVDRAIDQCFTFAAWADKHAGAIDAVPQRAVALSLNQPTGVIGVLTDDAAPLAAPMRAITAALAMGNSVVVNAPWDFPLSVLDLADLAESADLPAGALNLISGDPSEIGEAMARHAGIAALWDFYNIGAARSHCAENVKRLLTGDPMTQPDQTLLRAACSTKTVWLPYGPLY